ncbi:MAG: hypothetical protein LKKZDAJK_002491 [Candidatus Fervidibacter sp.]
MSRLVVKRLVAINVSKDMAESIGDATGYSRQRIYSPRNGYKISVANPCCG